jgi:hypothetical protein
MKTLFLVPSNLPFWQVHSQIMFTRASNDYRNQPYYQQSNKLKPNLSYTTHNEQVSNFHV